MRKHEIFPSKYIKAADLQNKPHVATIDRAVMEAMKMDEKDQTKLVVYFRGAKKPLVANMTNFESIAAIAGDDETDDWSGVRVELYPTTVPFQGKVIDCIRIRAPSGDLPLAPKRPAPPPKPADDFEASADMDDEIPF